MARFKYIRTSLNIIIFDMGISHDTFKSFNPLSAGFIDIGFVNGDLDINCWGESKSLGIASMDADNEIARIKLER